MMGIQTVCLLFRLFIILTVLCLLPVQAVYAAGGESSPSLISLDIKSMDIIDVFKLLSMKSDLNIVVGKDVSGKMSIFLKDVDLWGAFEMIVAAQSLAYEVEGDIVRVMTLREYERVYGYPFEDKREICYLSFQHARAADSMRSLTQIKSTIGSIMLDERANMLIVRDIPERITEMQRVASLLDVPSITRVFKLNYAEASALKIVLEEHISPSVGVLEIDERTNTIIVKDTPEVMGTITSIVENFDDKNREVLIEARIVQVTLEDTFTMGINWETIFSHLDYLRLKGAFEVTPALAHYGQVTIGELDDPDVEYEAMMQMLRSVGTTELLSNPRITVLDREEAKIMVGTNQPFVTTTTVTPASGGTTTSEQVTFIEVGVKLYVTPVIHKDDFVTMKIKPEVSSLGTPLTTAQGNQIPVVNTSEAQTRVTIQDGTTIVIAGLIKDTTTETVNKVPLLGDIPLVGHAFKNKKESKEKTELVIFLTPHIITGSRNDRSGSHGFSSRITDLVPDESQEDRPLAPQVVPDTAVDEPPLQQSYDDLIQERLQQVLNGDMTASFQGERADICLEISPDGRLAFPPQVVNASSEAFSFAVCEALQRSFPLEEFASVDDEGGDDAPIFFSVRVE